MATPAITRLSVPELRQKFTRLQKTYSSLKQRTTQEYESVSARFINGVLTVSGGATVGVLRGALGEGPGNDVKLPGTNVDADLAIGTMAALAAVAGFAGRYSDEIGAFGHGVLAAVTAREIEVGLRKPG